MKKIMSNCTLDEVFCMLEDIMDECKEETDFLDFLSSPYRVVPPAKGKSVVSVRATKNKRQPVSPQPAKKPSATMLEAQTKVKIEPVTTYNEENDPCVGCKDYVPEKVIFNPPATIVYWCDNTRTVVKCHADDDFNPETGLAMAVMKKHFGNDNTYKEMLAGWCGNGC